MLDVAGIPYFPGILPVGGASRLCVTLSLFACSVSAVFLNWPAGSNSWGPSYDFWLLYTYHHKIIVLLNNYSLEWHILWFKYHYSIQIVNRAYVVILWTECSANMCLVFFKLKECHTKLHWLWNPGAPTMSLHFTLWTKFIYLFVCLLVIFV